MGVDDTGEPTRYVYSLEPGQGRRSARMIPVRLLFKDLRR